MNGYKSHILAPQESEVPKFNPLSIFLFTIWEAALRAIASTLLGFKSWR